MCAGHWLLPHHPAGRLPELKLPQQAAQHGHRGPAADGLVGHILTQAQVCPQQGQDGAAGAVLGRVCALLGLLGALLPRLQQDRVQNEGGVGLGSTCWPCQVITGRQAVFPRSGDLPQGCWVGLYM